MAFDRSSSTLRVRVDGGTEAGFHSVEGEVDLSTSSSSFEDALLQALREHPNTLVLDLSGVIFIDSQGATSLASARGLPQVLECRLSLVVGSPRAQRVLEARGVVSLFEVAGTKPDVPGTVAS